MAEEFSEKKLQERMASFDKMLRKMEVKTSDIVQEGSSKAQRSAANSKNFNSRG
jgi:hypothetical protein